MKGGLVLGILLCIFWKRCASSAST